MFDIVSHTADVRLKLYGKTLEELFASAAAGLAFLLNPPDGLHAATRIEKTFSADGRNSTELLVNFLNEIVTESEIHKVVYDEVQNIRFENSAGVKKVSAALRGYSIERFDTHVKAVTYHEAKVTQHKNGKHEALLVLDI